MKRHFLEKRRVLQDLVLGAFAGKDMPRRKEITYFLVGAVVFLAVSVLLLIRSPDQVLHTSTAYYMFHQMFTQFANARCRLRDGADLKAMDITELATYRGKKINGGRVN